MNVACDVIVLTWNQLEMTRKFIKSFLDKTIVPTRLMIIDNGSRDGTKNFLHSLQSTNNCQFRIILNEDNKGFVEGMNQGISESTAPYTCLVNNDVIFSKGWLKEIISVFEKNKKIGFLNPNSNNLGTKVFQGETIDNFAKCLYERFKGEFMELPFCIGFCMIIKKEVIERVGGLSEEFKPMFFEDTDYGMKVQQAGYLIGVAKAAYVWHQEHGSFKQWPKGKEEAFVNSRKTFTKKWGRILRIAWIVEKNEDLISNLDKAIKLARGGSYVWFLVRDLEIDEEDIFKRNNFFVHSGVKFIKYKSSGHLVWKILKKKKKYHLLISRNRFIRYWFNKFGYTVIEKSEKEEIKKLKNICLK